MIRRRNSSRSTSQVIGLISLLTPCAVLAQPATTAVPADARAQARERFTHAVQLMEQGLFNEAISELETARGLSSTPAVMFNLGMSYRAVGKQRKAIEAFREYLRLAGPGVSARNRTEAEGYLGEMTAASIHLTLDVAPAGVSIVLDGEPLISGSRDFDWDSLAGNHTIITRADGFETDVQTFDVPRGGRKTVTVHLRSLAPQLGHVRIESDVPDAVVVVDAREVGVGQVQADLAPGPHHVEVRAPGHTSFQRDIDIRAGETSTLVATLPVSVSPGTGEHHAGTGGSVFTSPVFWAITGIVVVGAAVGITAGVLASQPLPGATVGAWSRVDVY